jgi:hypothetical protein
MHNWRKYTVMVLIVGLLNLPLADLALARDGKSSEDAAAIKQKVEMFGVGASLKVRLTARKKMKGSLVSLGEDGFELTAKAGEAPRYIAYSNANQITLAKLKYRTKGVPDAVEARRVALGLGIGRHIQVKTTAGQEYHGNIQVIGPDTFTMLPDHQTVPVEIAFSEVGQIGPNLNTAAKIAIGVGIAVGVVVLVMVAVYVWGPSS